MSRFKDALGDDIPPWLPAARKTDPLTSHQAAERASKHADTDRDRVLQVHAKHPHGLTDFQLAEIMGSQQTSCGKRRHDLVMRGYIRATRLRRPAPSGSPSIVWIITPLGLDAARGAARRAT